MLDVVGKVVICQNGVYSSVCDVNWDRNDANVLCNSIGFSCKQQLHVTIHISIIPSPIICIIVGTPLYGFDAGTKPIILEDVQCTGVESNILACPTSAMGEINNPLCSEPNRVAGVRCNLEPGCFDGAVRLVNGSSFYEGRLEVCANNQWLSVCGAGFDTAAASEVCSGLLLGGGI